MGSMDPDGQFWIVILCLAEAVLIGMCVRRLVRWFRSRHARRARHDRAVLAGEEEQAWRALASRRHQRRDGPEPEKAWWRR